MATAVRKEIHDVIDDIPEHSLGALRPLLYLLRDNGTDDRLSDEERVLLEECRRDRIERPESFKSWEEVRGE